MTGRRLVGVLLACGVGAAVFFAWPRPTLSPEDEVRALVAGMLEAAGRRDAGGVTGALADDFRGDGGATKQTVQQLVLGHLMRSPDAPVVLNPSLDVEVQGPDAASFDGVFVFARSPGDGLGRYDISGTLVRQGGRWRITTARWRRAGE